MVALRATVPTDAFTADTLGTERAGNGVIIRGNGLVLTIGYLITEADTIWLTLNDGRSVPGHVLGYDQETGFGLVQALAKLDMPALEIGQIGGRLARRAGRRRRRRRARSIRSPRASSPNRSSPVIGNTCSTRRSSRRRRIRTGAARR